MVVVSAGTTNRIDTGAAGKSVPYCSLDKQGNSRRKVMKIVMSLCHGGGPLGLIPLGLLPPLVMIDILNDKIQI